MVKSLIFGASLLLSVSVCAEVVVKNGDKIGFLGDSITHYGNYHPGGYVNLVISGLEANGIKAEKIPAGISGHKSNQMLERVEKDVLSKNPAFMLLSCGVNDVWHGRRGVELPEYKKNITAIIDKAQSAGVKVCIMTATMITEDPKHSYNIKLASYNEFLRELAKEKGCMLADLNEIMQKGVVEFAAKNPGFKGNYYTNDGVHMNALGDAMMAESILRTFGMDDAQIAKAKAAWQGRKVSVGKVVISADVLEKVAVKAAKKNMSILEYIEFAAENMPSK